MKQKTILTKLLFICILCGLSAESNRFKLLTTEEAQNLVRDQSAARSELEYLRSETDTEKSEVSETLFVLLPDEMVADIVGYEKNKFSIRMPRGIPVYPLWDGYTVSLRYSISDGNFITIQSRDIIIDYTNLTHILIARSRQDEIKSSELIAYSGMTGPILEPQLGIRIEAAEDSDRDYAIYLITSKSLK
ncbi:M23 family metallopeptidase [Brucepastera parasyntrophica]|uniref:M23 family metallopeptidase n=1 Tax=Brucepastera parasyntrophica TaxID=2880008 RepID=UPI0021091EFB|nr:M23 family metallopeptidase [Brucepastera parasyntrophica]ULQ58880.1 M23 family metallopeptidase [Brucepastera parasyntrophica]